MFDLSSQMASILRKYNNFVLRSPLLAMSLTTGTASRDDASDPPVSLGTTMGLGNIISQTVIEKRALTNLDWARIARFSAFGYLFTVQFPCHSLARCFNIYRLGTFPSLLVLRVGQVLCWC